MAPQFRQILLFQKDLRRAIDFYKYGLGAKVLVETQKWAQVDAKGLLIAMQQVDSADKEESDSQSACLKPGGSPSLMFDVCDLPQLIPRLIQHGAEMDGPIKFQALSKVAVIRDPSGHSIALLEAQPRDNASTHD